jgi:ATP-dependent DNA helicase DinG
LNPFQEQRQLEIREIFGAEGLIEQSLPGFELRPQQLQMAEAGERAFESGRHLVAESGTGVGKSFAYLVPAIRQVTQKKGKVLVSTFTITLQEQLINKDIPFLLEIFPDAFTAVLAKGRGNYLCLRRLAFAGKRQQRLFDDFGSGLAAISEWAKRTRDGSLSDLPFVPSIHLWDAVKSEHGNCRRRKCPHFRNCFYWQARRRLEAADIIVANHALLFSDLVLKEETAGVLPDYRYVIIDEAHNIEQVAEEHFGINISNYAVTFMLNGLYNARTQKGILAFMDAENQVGLVRQCAQAAKVFFKRILDWYEQTKDETNGRCWINFVDDNLTGPLQQLRLALARLAKAAKDEDEKFELTRYAERCTELANSIQRFLKQPDHQSVYWVETKETGRVYVSLRSAPINVGPDVERCLFDKFESVLLTSATLSTDGKDEKTGFDFFAARTGLRDFDALKLGSPFDYEKQVTMYIEPDLPNPNDEAYVAAAAEVMKKYIRLTKGRAFVLFTSYSMLNKIAQELGGWLKENDFSLFQQGAGADRTTLLTRFKSEPNSVLFGADSFWQGIDVPGEALSNVIICRLPFAVPNHPLRQGRIEQLREAGENPFYKYQLPWAIIKFKQGFGRLVRSKNDKGIVVVLDSRIIHKSYGKQFLTAIPKCKVVITGRRYKAGKAYY